MDVALSSIFDVIEDNVVTTWVDCFVLIEEKDVVFDITFKTSKESWLEDDVRRLASFALFELRGAAFVERLL